VKFVNFRGEASWMARRHSRAPNVVVNHGKVCKGPLQASKGKNQDLSGVRKMVERDPTWSWPW
jgi:hypothetical protein